MNRIQSFLCSVFPKYKERVYSRMYQGNSPVFTSFGEDIYISDIVKQALHAIALETSKITLKSVIEKDIPHQIVVQQDSITRLFKYKPNPLMTTQEFFYKVAWLRKKNLNAFIYPKYKIVGGRKEYVAFYPLNPTIVEFGYINNELYINMHFENGEHYNLPYSEIIHLRDEFSFNNFLGGNSEGNPENKEILKTVSIMDKAMQGLPKAISASLQVKGVYNVKTQIDADKLRNERKDFEKELNDSESGIVALGYAGEFTPMNISPQLIPSDILKWLDEKVLRNYGVSMAIITGDFTETQSSAFFQKCIEDFIIQAEQSFSSILYSLKQQDEGYKIKIYDRLVQHLSMETRLKIAELYVPTGYVDEDEARELIGFEPNGRKRTVVSLNYIDIDIANAYQLSSINRDRERGEKK